MKLSKIVSLVLVCVMLLSAFTLVINAAQAISITFLPESKNGIIYGTAAKTPQNIFRMLYANKGIEIFDKNGKKVDPSSTAYIGTGFTAKIGGRVLYPIVVLGDFDGDGELTARDYILTKRACMGSYPATSIAKQAAGAEPGGELRPIHYIKIKRAYFGTYEINKKYTCDPYNPYELDDGWSDTWV